LTVWINGRRGRSIDALDRGLQYGDGVFETMRVRHGRIRLLDLHLERLESACARLALGPPDFDAVRRELERRAALRREAALKLIITRGVGPRGYRPRGTERCTRVLSLHSLRPGSAPTAPVRVRMCGMRLGVNERLAGLKTLNRLESVLARAEWTDARVWEGLLRDPEGNIICGTMSNLFIRTGAQLATPLLDRCGVAGVMRRWVLTQARRMPLRIAERRIRWLDLAAADEAFLTNAVVGIVPIARITDGRAQLAFTAGATALELAGRLELT
jgi:4-amino-4-deoxychorismate lyase